MTDGRRAMRDVLPRPAVGPLSLFGTCPDEIGVLHSLLINTDATRCAKGRRRTARHPYDPAHRAAPA